MARLLAFLLHWFLRLLVRPRLKPDVDVIAERSRLAELGKFGKPLPQNLVTIEANLSGISSTLLRTNYSDKFKVLYIHGGGFVWDLRSAYIHYAAQLCEPLEAEVVLPWYRLAPEHPFPAALEDCFAIYQHLLADGDSPENIVLIGDSAGGNLVLSCLMKIRERGFEMPCCAVLISPVTDLSEWSTSWILNGWSGRDPVFGKHTFPLLRHYCGEHSSVDPLLSPYYGEFSDLCPLLFISGEREALLDDSISVAKRARAAGTPVEMQVWKDMPHVFPMMHLLPQAKEAQQEIVDFIQARGRRSATSRTGSIIIGKGF